MDRKATAVWRGSLKEGSGTFSGASGAFQEIPYSFRTRFEEEPGTNPEELIAAAHSACFSMALSAELGQRGIVPDRVATTANVGLASGSVTHSRLEVTVRAPGAERQMVEEAAQAAKLGCPISKLLNAPITMDLVIE